MIMPPAVGYEHFLESPNVLCLMVVATGEGDLLVLN